MSLKGYAMLAAIGYHNHRSSSSTNNSTQSTIRTTPATPALLSTTWPAKTINSNKSTLIQLKQQQSDIVLTTTTSTSAAATPPTLTMTPQSTPAILNPPRPPSQTFNIPMTSSSSSATSYAPPPPAPAPVNPYRSSDHFETYTGGDDDHHHHQQHPHLHSPSSSSSGNIYTDSNEEDEAATTGGGGGVDGVDNDLAGRQRPVNTFYGSGFGIFHQQRSNMGGAGGGGGIALITGSSGSGLGSSSYSNGINNNVNLLLGGAMLTLITTILCVVCYCCHRNIKKRTEAAYRQQRQWLENDPNMEIYSVEQCYETSGLFVGDSMDGLATIPALHHEPPPSYDAVVAMQEQQQLLIQQQQQQLLMQQLQNNSPPPGYRSSLDVSCILTARTAALAPAVLGMGSTDTNGSLTASTMNVRASCSRATPDGHDLNGNRDMAAATTSAAAACHLQQPNFLRAAKQRQRPLPTANLTNFNMKKVLQAQSCCSLQRAEVENMWNAAAAALAARSNHISNDPRGTASTSSPTLVMNNRKLSNGHTSKANTPETFGSRYLKQQNYYRRGCPLCGKFRYDNESTLSISIDSDLDNMTAVGGGAPLETGQHNEDNARDENLNSVLESIGGNEGDDDEEGEDDECSCSTAHHRQLRQRALRNPEAIAVAVVNPYTNDNNNQLDVHNANVIREDIELTATTDMNDNERPMTKEEPSQPETTTSSTLSNNNEEPSCSTVAEATTSESAGSTSSPPPSVSTPPSSNSITIDLDCINENGIISLDMSKIIDKTGLPTYDAALKLESSGYV